ncbi:hypothetical protein L218DRAFT_956989 [Marasmius fiardii PR-910]|nr:hypothetical protein L218DRAFT_956989 [Marasmius fiardii PR-910]
MTGIQDLPFDILLYIMSSIYDRRALYDYIRVNKVFYEAGVPSLYRRISLVVLRACGSGSGLNFPPLDTLDKHPYLRSYVEDVEICFGLNEYVKHQAQVSPSSGLGSSSTTTSALPPPQWSKSLSHLQNIISLTISHPENRYHPLRADFSDTLISAISGSSDSGKLVEISLLARINAVDITRWRKVKSVRRVRFGLLTSGTSTFRGLGEWLKECKCEGLSVMEAYAVEQSMMKQISPYLGSLTTLHIGPSHALPNRDLLVLLGSTPRLRFFDALYDNFLSVSMDPQYASTPTLTDLEAIVIRHSGVWSKPSCQDLFRFLRLVLTSSSKLKSFNLLSDDGKEIHHPQTGLIDLLCSTQGLEVLNLPSVVFRQPLLVKVFEAESLKGLRVVSLFVIDVKVLEFYQHLNQKRDKNKYKHKISAVYLRSNRSTCPYFSVVPEVKKMMNVLRGGVDGGCFQRLVQERQRWQALWTEGPMTDRTGDGGDLLKYEYPEMYRRFV